MSLITIELQGQKEVNSVLRDFEKKSGEALMTAIKLTGLRIESASKTRLRERKHWITGRLASSIHSEVKEGVVGQTLTVSRAKHKYSDEKGNSYDGAFNEPLGDLELAVGTNVKYAGAIEHGSSPHIIEAVKAKFLKFTINGTTFFRRKVNHPGTEGDSFLRWAAVQNDEQLKRYTEEQMNKRIKEANERLK